MEIVRTFTIQRKPEGRYWLTGAPRNWRQGDCWLVAHDTFHHFADDDGSVAHEVMSFGVECWLETPRAGLTNSVSYGTLAGTLAEEFDEGVTAKRLARLMVPAPPDLGLPPVSPEVKTFLAFLVRDGLAEVIANLEGHHEANLSGDTRQALQSRENIKRYSQWAALGYARAQALYPDAKAFVGAFELLQSCVKKMAHDDHARFSLLENAALVVENRAAARCAQRLVNESMYEPGDRLLTRPSIRLTAVDQDLTTV